jgi:hypothetical protein
MQNCKKCIWKICVRRHNIHFFSWPGTYVPGKSNAFLDESENNSCSFIYLVWPYVWSKSALAEWNQTNLIQGNSKKKVTLSHVYNEEPVSLQSRDIQQLFGKLSKFVCNWRRKVLRAAAARGDRVARWRLHSKRHSVSYFLPETLSCFNYKQTLRVFRTIAVYRVIVGSLVTSLLTCESVTFFLNCPVLAHLQNSEEGHGHTMYVSMSVHMYVGGQCACIIAVLFSVPLCWCLNIYVIIKLYWICKSPCL